MKKKEILKEVLLKMYYDNKRTLSENEFFLIEQTNPIDYSSVEKSQGIERTLNMNDYKTANDWCNRGSVKNLEFVVDNLNGNETFKGKKGYCRLSKKTQDSLKSQYGASSAPYFAASNQDQWFAIYALWVSQEVEAYKMINIWNSMPTGKCEKNKLYVNLQGQEISLEDALTGRKTINYDGKKMKSLFVCYNEDIAVYKPYDQIRIKNITSNSGRVDPTSLSRYSGKYIPSFAEVVKGYGYAGNYNRIMNGLSGSKETWQYMSNQFGKGTNSKIYTSGKPSTGLENLDTHDLLTILQIGTVFIPIVGPFISAGIGLGEAYLYYEEGDKNMAALSLLFTFAFDIPGMSSVLSEFAEGGVRELSEKELENIMQSTISQDISSLSKKEKDFLITFKQNYDPYKKNLEDYVIKNADDILSDPAKSAKLDPNSIKVLQGLSSKTSKLKTGLQTVGFVGGGAVVGAKVKEMGTKTVKKEIEDSGFTWEEAKSSFMSDGSVEDNLLLQKAWQSGWRPEKDGKPMMVPEEYRTKKYKNYLNKLFGIPISTDNKETEKLQAKQSENFGNLVTSSEKSVATRDSLQSTNTEFVKNNNIKPGQVLSDDDY